MGFLKGDDDVKQLWIKDLWWEKEMMEIGCGDGNGAGGGDDGGIRSGGGDGQRVVIHGDGGGMFVCSEW